MLIPSLQPDERVGSLMVVLKLSVALAPLLVRRLVPVGVSQVAGLHVVVSLVVLVPVAPSYLLSLGFF